jgi:phenylalanyl-tRNA synthetase beta chain
MKFTLAWLGEHLETDVSLEHITSTLTRIGLEVEKVVDKAALLAPFSVAEVLVVEKHPNADRLTVCQVQTGREIVQVVCGADNVRAGMKGVFAPAGTQIPGTGLDLKAAKIRGVESNGMLCSERELMISDEHQGIIELADDAPVGTPYTETSGLDAAVIEVAVTPNRQDCLGIGGIARDLAAVGLGKLKDRTPEPVAGKYESPIGVSLDFDTASADACPLFVGRHIRGLKNLESPQWLRARLVDIGLRPISALVDITNFITFDRGRPLHVFDAAKLNGDIHARLAKKGEKLLALDGRSYELEGPECVIADDKSAVGLGGVIGGEATACTEETTDVFVEAAFFDPLRTATTGRRHGIESDARYRFERGIDPEFVIPGMELATQLILEICGGEPSQTVIAGDVPEWKRTVAFRPQRIQNLGGLDLPAGKSVAILESLGFSVKGKPRADSMEVAVPSWRSDIDGEADLVEEVLRISGYDAIPAVSLPRQSGVAVPTLTRDQIRARATRRRLASEGLEECMTWSFMSASTAKLFGGDSEALRLQNPISSELDVMRPSILPNLLAAAQRNLDRSFRSVALFEVGPQYADDTAEGQALVAAGIRVGEAGDRHWSRPLKPLDAFDAKADALAALEAGGAPAGSLRVAAEAPSWYHPGRSGSFLLGPKQMLGTFGEIHPGILTAMKVDGPAVGFEVFLGAVPARREKKLRTREALEASDLQVVDRDFAFLVKDKISAQDIVGAARGAAAKHIQSVSVFDLYAGEDLEAGTKSVAISVRFVPREKTFTDQEIDQLCNRIVIAVAKATGGKQR